MGAESRYVVLGLATARSPWFRDVGRWSTAAAIPVDFVRCVSAEELRARLGSGRAFSAVLLDGGTPGIDRDLVADIVDTGAGLFVVSDGRTTRDWVAWGATAVLAQPLERNELVDQLERHARSVASSRPLSEVLAASAPPRGDWCGRLVAVTGGSGAGTSTVAMALAQGLGRDPRYAGFTLLADLALHADQALLHDAGDVIPGVQEVVEAHQYGSADSADVKTMVFDTNGRGYDLMLGLRRHRDWSVLRPRAVAATLEGLTRAYRVVVADIDADLEGESETGSVDIEERNLLARSVVRRADLVLAVATPTIKGLHDAVRVVGDLVSFGLEPQRVLPVLNRSGRPGRGRAEVTRALAELLAPISDDVASALHVPERRRLEEVVRDGAAVPASFAHPVAEAVLGTLDRVGPRAAVADDGPRPIVPGTVGHLADLDDTGTG